MEGRTGLDSLRAQTEAVLADVWGGQPRLDVGTQLTEAGRRNLVVRFAVVHPSSSAPATVLVKQANTGDYDPERPSPATLGLFSDWAGVQFLSAIERATPLSPRFYGGDRAAGLVVLEDLATTGSLADLLLGTDAPAAERALIYLAAGLGQMHAATIGKAADFARVWATLHPPDESAPPLWTLSAAESSLHAALGSLGITPEDTFWAEVHGVAQSMEDPGPFSAYTHGDPCPDNCLLTPSGLRMIDFEIGRFRHALTDGVYGHVNFPTCWCANQLPPRVVTAMEDTYRSALVTGCPQAADDALFGAAVTEACAFWTLGWLGEPLTRALTEDNTWGIATVRQRIAARVTAFLRVAEERDCLPSIRLIVARVYEELERRWTPEERDLPYYPPFRSQTS